jgi:hypothetical protein
LRLLMLLGSLMLAGLLTGVPESATAAPDKACVGCTNSDYSGLCSCFHSIFMTCNGQSDRNCGALGG